MPQPTILLVDDSPQGLAAMRGVLTPEGYALLEAADGVSAIAVARAALPDVVLLDVMMPDVDGYETCRRLRADPTLCDIPIVLVTALDDRASKLAGIDAGADDFLTKPIDRLELRARVRGLVRMNRFRRALDERDRFAWVIEQADEGYVHLDPAGRIAYLNPVAREYLDVPAGTPDAVSFAEIAGRTYRTADGGPVALTPGLPSCTLVRPASAGALAFWLDVRIHHEPRTGETWLRLRDVSAAHRTRRDTGTFHSVIQHKLNTPLNGLLGCATLLADLEPDSPPEEVAETGRLAALSAQRLHADIQGILGYLEAVRQAAPGHLAAADLPAVVETAAQALSLAGLDVAIAPEARDARLPWSGQTAEVVLRELFVNAGKFHPARRPRVAVDLTVDAGDVVLAVTDDGVWLSPEQRERAWRPYGQGDLGETGEISGPGLGLPLVATLVAEAGGSSRLMNRSDAPGVCVVLRLPACGQGSAGASTGRAA